MFINFILSVLLFGFILSSCFSLFQDRKNAYGLIVKLGDGDKVVSNGKNLQVSFGRDKGNDIIDTHSTTSRKHMVLTRAGNAIYPEGRFANNCKLDTVDYTIGDNTYNFSINKNYIKLKSTVIPTVFAIVFTVIHSLKIINEFKIGALAIPFILLVCYQVLVFSYDYKRNIPPIIELSGSVLIQFFIYATIFKELQYVKAIIGVIFFVIFSFGAKLLFSYIRMSKEHQSRLIKRNFSTNDAIRAFCVAGIILLILINVIFSEQRNGAYNWVSFGQFGFQPGELIKILFVITICVPIDAQSFNKANAFYLLALPFVVFLYALLIKDIGCLAQLVVAWSVALILQSNSLVLTTTILTVMYAGIIIVKSISHTASVRINDYYIDNNLWLSMSGEGAFKTDSEAGMQIVRAIRATVSSGGLYGNKYYKDLSIMKHTFAGENDLVLASICEHYGIIIGLLIVLLYAVIFASALSNLKRQHKIQQLYSMIFCSIIITAVICNIGGTYSIVPLSGVVCPLLSSGLSAVILYSTGIGIATSHSPHILEIIEASEPVEEKISLNINRLRRRKKI